MKRLGYAVFTAFMLLLAALSPALADHMNGSYAGVGVDEGINLAITQSGTTVTGQLTGNENGFLEGVSDGGDNVSGTISLNDGTVFQFTAVWSAASFDITLFDNTGTTELHSFVPATGDPQPEPEPEPDTASTQYWVYDNNQQYGPLTLDQVLARIASGESNRETQVWTVELNTWVLIDTVPEFVEALGPVAQPEPDVAAIEYWTFDNEQQFGPFTLQQVLDRIASGESNRETQIWTSANQQWVMIDTVAELVDALPPVEQEPAAVEYWTFDNNEQFGPFTLQQVFDRIASGESNRETQIWTSTNQQWVMIDTVAELAAALPTVEQDVAEKPSYYLYYQGNQSGPYTTQQMLDGIAQGTVPRGSLVWQPGWAEWVRVETVEQFAVAFPPAVPADIQYFVIVNGERVGPLTEADVNARITSLESRATDLAWKRGLEAWAPLSTFAEFADAIAAVETPPVPPTDVEVPPIVEPEVEEPPQLPDDVVEPPEVVEPEVPDVPEVVETPEVIEEPEVIEPPEVVEEEVVEEEVPEPPAFDSEAFQAMVEAMVTEDLGDEVAPEKVAEAIACVAEALDPLTVEEKQALMDAGLNPPKELLDTLEAAYPGLTEWVNSCGETARGDTGGTVEAPVEETPAVEEPPAVDDAPATDDTAVVEEPAAEEDAFAAALRANLEERNAPADQLEIMLACALEVAEVLTDAEKQAILDSGFNLPAAELDAIEAAHPGFQEASLACEPA